MPQTSISIVLRIGGISEHGLLAVIWRDPSDGETHSEGSSLGHAPLSCGCIWQMACKE